MKNFIVETDVIFHQLREFYMKHTVSLGAWLLCIYNWPDQIHNDEEAINLYKDMQDTTSLILNTNEYSILINCDKSTRAQQLPEVVCIYDAISHSSRSN